MDIFMPPPLGAGAIMFSGWYWSGLNASILVWHTCASALSGWVLYRQLELTKLTHPDLHHVVGLFMLKDVRPSVRSLKYSLLTCTWVSWSTRPTVTVLRHVRLSVRLEKFPGICQRTHGGNDLKFYMLMYLDHLQNCLVYGCGLLNFLILALFDLVKWVKFGVSGHFPENT